MMRIVDILYSLPFIFFVILLVVFFGRNFVLIFIAVGAVEWLDMARIVRGQTLSHQAAGISSQAAEALGVSTRRASCAPHHPQHCSAPVVVYVTLLVPQVILLESFLSFLGLGVQEPLTSWGVLIARGRDEHPGRDWLLIFPAIFLVVDPVRAQLPRRRPARRARPEGPLTMADEPDPVRSRDLSGPLRHA